MIRTQPPPSSVSELLERIEADLAIADAHLRFWQGNVDDLKRAREALLLASQRYAAEETP